MAYADKERGRAYHREYQRAYRTTHRKECKAYMEAYRVTHRAEANTQRIVYRAAHPETALLANARQRARRYGVPCTLTRADVRELLTPMRCAATGLPLIPNTGKGKPSALSPSIDRIEPARGYVPGNVRLVCFRFNEVRKRSPVSHDYRHVLRVLAETDHEGDRIEY